MGGAIGANDFVFLAHIQEYVGMIKGGKGANTLEFFCANFNTFNALAVMEVGNRSVGHNFALVLRFYLWRT